MGKCLFTNNISHCDEFYRIIRDEERCVKYNNYVESLWDIYSQYADKDFPKQLSQDFHARFWEMYLTCTLIYNSFKVVPKSTRSKGPDILVEDLSQRIFLEAVAPSKGSDNNIDRVPNPEVNSGKAGLLPDTKIMLRYSSVIADKYNKYLNYLKQGIISQSDSYVIALNSCKIGILAKAEADYIPRIIKVVLPIGDKEVPISSSPKPMLSWHYQYRPNINRLGGSTVPTDLFLVDEYAGLSGVLYSDSDVANRPTNMGDEFIFIHNPKSKYNPVPHGYFNLGKEYYIDLAQKYFSISFKDWNNKS